MVDGQSTLEIKLETSQALSSADQLDNKLRSIDTTLGNLNKSLDGTKSRVFKVDVALNQINVTNEIVKIQKAFDAFNYSIKIKTALAPINVDQEIRKIQEQFNRGGAIQLKVSLNSSTVQADARAIADTIGKTSAKIKVSTNSAEVLAAEQAMTRLANEEYQRRSRQLTETLRTYSEQRIAQNKAEVEAMIRQDQTYLAAKAAYQERSARSTLSNVKAAPEAKQAAFQSQAISLGTDVNQIKQQGAEVASAWRSMYAALQAEASRNMGVVKELSRSAVNDINAQTRAKIEALKAETALTKDERAKAVEMVRSGGKQMIAQYKDLEVSVKGTWDAVRAAGKTVMNDGIAQAKTTTNAHITEVKRLESEYAALQVSIANAGQPLSWLASKLEESRFKAQGLVTVFNELGNVQHFEVVNSLKSQLDVLRQGFANLKISDNTQVTSEFQNKLASAYDNARKAADEFAKGNNTVAAQFITDTNKEIAQLETLRQQFLATTASASAISGKSQLSDSLRQAAEQAEVLSVKFKELVGYKFDNITSLQRQLEGLKNSFANLAPTGAEQNAKILDLQAAAYRKLEAAAIAAGKNQSYAFGMAMTDAQNYLSQLKALETEMTRFSTAKIQTKSLADQAEADAKAAIAASKEVYKTKLAQFDDEANRQRQLIDARLRGNEDFMRGFNNLLSQERTAFRDHLAAEQRAVEESINQRLTQYRRVTEAVSQLPESRVGRVESANAAVGRSLGGAPFVQNISSTMNTAELDMIRRTTEAHAAGRRTMIDEDQAYFRSLTSNILGAIAAYGLLRTALHAVTDVYEHIKETSLTAQKMTTVMTVISGSAAEAREQLEWLRDTADKIGLSFEASAAPFAKFAAAAKGMFPVEQIKEMYVQLGKVAVAMHLDQQETKGVFLAMQQMASKGKVSLEELRLQFAERIPGAMTIAADSMGMTMTAFTKAVSNGMVSSEEFVPKFLASLSQTFDQAADVASKGLMGSLNRLENALFKLWERVGEAGAADAIKRAADKITDLMNNNAAAVERFGVNFGRLIDMTVDFVVNFLSSADAIDSMNNMFRDTVSIVEGFATALTEVFNLMDKLGTVKFATLGTAAGAIVGSVAPGLGTAAGAAWGGTFGASIDANLYAEKMLNKVPTNEATASAATEAEKNRRQVAAMIADNERLEKNATAMWEKIKSRTMDATAVMVDLRDASVAALKPNTAEDYAKTIVNAANKTEELRSQLEALYKVQAEGYPGLNTGNLGTQLELAKTKLTEFTQEKAKLESTPFPVEDAQNHAAALDEINKKYDIALKRVQFLDRELHENDKIEKQIRDDMSKASDAAAKSVDQLSKSYEQVRDRIKEVNEAIKNSDIRQVNYEAMSTPEIKFSTKDMQSQFTAFDEQIISTQMHLADLQTQMEKVQGSSKPEDMLSITRIKKDLDESQDALSSAFKAREALRSSLESAYKSLFKNMELETQATNSLKKAQQSMSDKQMVASLAARFDFKGMDVALAMASAKVSDITREMARQDEIRKDYKRSQDEIVAAESKYLGLEQEKNRYTELQTSLKNAEVEANNKILSSQKEQLNLQRQLLQMQLELNKQIGEAADYQKMSVEQLLRQTSEAFTPQEIVSTVTPTLDTSAMTEAVQDWGRKVDVKVNKVDMSALVASESAKAGIPAALAKAVMRAESGFNPNAVSSVGAKGLMQLMPDTATRYGLSQKDIFDPAKNIVAGIKYLGDLFKMFKGDAKLTAAAYNAGEGAVKKYKDQVPPYKETQGYVKKVLGFMSTEDLQVQVDQAAQGLKPVVLPVSVDSTSLVTEIGLKSQATIENLTPNQKAFASIKNYQSELNKLVELTRTGSKEEMTTFKQREEALKIIKAGTDVDIAKAKEYTKALMDARQAQSELTNAAQDNLQISINRAILERSAKRGGMSTIGQLDTAAVESANKLVELGNERNAVARELDRLISSNNDSTLTAEESNRLVNDQISKSIQLSREINIEQAKHNDQLQTRNGLQLEALAIMQDQQDELKALTDKNVLGEKGSLRERMKKSLGDSFKEWDLKQQQIELQKFYEAAGLGIDTVSSDFSNAFRQMAVDGKSFTDSLGDMFQSMIDRMLSASIDLVTSNAFALLSGSGGSWANLGVGIIGTGIGLLSNAFRSTPKQTPSPSTNSTAYGAGATALADTLSRKTGFEFSSTEAVKMNRSLDTLASVLRSNTDAIFTWTKQIGEQLASTSIGAAIADVFKPVTSSFTAISNMWSGVKNWAVSIGTEIAKPIVNMLPAAITGGAGLASTIGSTATLGSLPVTITGVSGSAASNVSLIGTKMPMEFGSLPVSPTVNATSAAAETGASQVFSKGMAALAVLKLGFDLFTIAGNDNMKTWDKITGSLYATSDALLAIGVATANVPVLIAAAAVNTVTAVSSMIKDGFTRENVGRLLFGFLGPLILPARTPNTWMNTFNPSTTAEAPLSNQGKPYDFSNVNTVYIDGKNVAVDAKGFYASEGNKSATRGVVTPFGATQISIHEIKGAKAEDLKSYDPLLSLIQTVDTKLYTAVNSMDKQMGETGKTMEYYNKVIGNTEGLTRVATKQDLENANYAKSIADRYNWIVDQLAKSGSKAGQIINVWYDVFTSKFEEVTKDSATQILGIIASLTTAVDGSKSGLEALSTFPVELADLVMKSVQAVKKGGDAKAVQDEIMKVIGTYEFLREGLSNLKIGVDNTTIVNFLANLNAVGYSMADAGQAIAGYAAIFVKSNKNLIESLSAQDIGKIFVQKIAEFDAALTKAGFTDVTRRTTAIGSSAMFAGMASEQGINASQDSLIKFAKTVDETGFKASQAARDTIDHLIATEDLTKVSRESAIATLVTSGKLKEQTVAEAELGAAISNATKDLVSSMGFISSIGDYAGKSLGEMSISADTWLEAGRNVVNVFGDLTNAAKVFDDIARRVLSPTQYAQGKFNTAQKTSTNLLNTNKDLLSGITLSSVETALTTGQGLDAYVAEIAKGSKGNAKLINDYVISLLDVRDSNKELQTAQENASKSVTFFGDMTIQSTDKVVAAFGSLGEGIRSTQDKLIALASPDVLGKASYQNRAPAANLAIGRAQVATGLQMPGMREFAAAIGLTPENAQSMIDSLVEQTASNVPGATAAYGALTQMQADNPKFKEAFDMVTGGLSLITSSTDALKSNSESASDALKSQNSAQKQVNLSVLAITRSDVQNGLQDVITKMDDLATSAADAGTAIPEFDKLRTEAIKKYIESVTKAVDDEFKTIGQTDIQKSIGSISQFAADEQKKVNDLVSMGGMSKDQGASYKGKVTSITKERLKVLWKSVTDEFNNIGKTDSEKNLSGVRAWLDDQVGGISKALSENLITADEALTAFSQATAVAADRIAASVKSIVDANDSLIKSSGKGQPLIDLQAIAKTYADQAKSLNTTTGGVGSTAYNQALDIVKSVSSQAASWVRTTGMGGLIDNLSSMISNVTSTSDVQGIAAWIHQTIQSNAGFADWYQKNAATLGSFADSLLNATRVLGNVSQVTTTTGNQAQNIEARNVAVNNWFKEVNTQFTDSMRSATATSVQAVYKFRNDWLEAIDFAGTNLGIPASVTQNAKDQVAVVVNKKLSDIFNAVTDEFNDIGKTAMQKEVVGIKTWAADWFNAIETAIANGMERTVAIAKFKEVGTVAAQRLFESFKAMESSIHGVTKSIADNITSIKVSQGTLKQTAVEAVKIQILRNQLAKASNNDERLTIIGDLNTAIMSRYNAEIDMITKVKESVNGIKKYLDDLKLGTLSTLSPSAKLDEARAQYSTTLAMARAGDQTALADVTTKADAYLKEAQSYFASSVDYASIYTSVTTALQDLISQSYITDEQFKAKTLAYQDAAVSELQALQVVVDQISKDTVQSFTNDMALLGQYLGYKLDGLGTSLTAVLGPVADYLLASANSMNATNTLYANQYNLPTFAVGGVTNTPAIFGEAGWEAAVPLPDGRTIPVTIQSAPSDNSDVVNAIYSTAGVSVEEMRRMKEELAARLAALERSMAKIESSGVLAGAM